MHPAQSLPGSDRRRLAGLAAALAGLTLVAGARADTLRWTGGGDSGDWNDPGNWVNDTPGGSALFPGEADDAVFDSDAEVTTAGTVGGLTVNGTLTLLDAVLAFPAAGGEITGAGSLLLRSTRGLAAGITGGPVTNRAALGGSGRLDTDLINDGVIDASRPGGAELVLTRPIENRGTLRASGGGRLVLGEAGTAADRSMRIGNNRGVIEAAEGSEVRLLASADVDDGPLTAAPGGTLLALGARLDGVELEGDLTVGDVALRGRVVNSATISFVPGAPGSVVIDQWLTLFGGGELRLASDEHILTGGPVTHGSHAIRGFGVIGPARLSQSGLIVADVPGRVLAITSPEVFGSSTGRFEARGGTLRIDSASFEAMAGLGASDGGVLEIAGGTVRTPVITLDTGGELRMRTAARLEAARVTGGFALAGTFAPTFLDGPARVEGDLTVTEATLEFRVAEPGAGPRLVVDGQLFFFGSGTGDLRVIFEALPEVGQRFDLLTAAVIRGGAVGSLTGVDDGGLFEIDLALIESDTALGVEVTGVRLIPEPAALGLVVLAGLGVLRAPRTR